MGIILFTGCSLDDSIEESVTETEVVVGNKLELEIDTNDNIQEVTYDFLDVYGESHTAVFLEDIPIHTYDYSRLNNQIPLYTYEDESGTITSTVGIDVSVYQGDIDWQAVKSYGIEFVIIRLGYRGYETGALSLDDNYESNIQGALDAGLDVGVYFFSQAITEAEALEEAEYVLEHIEGYEITMPVVFDTEVVNTETARTLDVDGEVFTTACITFCNRIEEAGYDTMIYYNLVWSAFTLDLEQLVEYDKWYADYYELPQYPYDYQMWQYSQTGSVPGIDGNVDLNIYFQ